MDTARVAALRELLAGTGWVDRASAFARGLRSSGHQAGGLLLVGTPDEEPWHMAAHLDDESRLSGIAEIKPTLVRWSPPPGAPPHLAVGLRRLEQARRGETVFVVAPDEAPDPLLERVFDARKVGATVLALDAGDAELDAIAHESLTVPPSANEGLVVPDFDVVSHLVSSAASDPTGRRAAGRGRAGVRERLARWLDMVGGA